MGQIEVDFRVRAVPAFRLLVADVSPRRRGFNPRSVDMRFVVDKVALGQVFALVIRFSPCQHHSTNAPYSFSDTCCSYQKDKGEKSVNLPKSNSVSEIGEYWTEKYRSLFRRLSKISNSDLVSSCLYVRPPHGTTLLSMDGFS